MVFLQLIPSPPLRPPFRSFGVRLTFNYARKCFEKDFTRENSIFIHLGKSSIPTILLLLGHKIGRKKRIKFQMGQNFHF